MDTYLTWFVLAALFAGAEMLTGTFYLLLYGVSCAVGGVMALLGLAEWVQFAVAGVCGVGATIYLRKQPFIRPAKTASTPDLGQRVQVESWKTDTLVRVKHRGAGWDAELAEPAEGKPDALYIVGQRANTLIVSAHPPGHHA